MNENITLARPYADAVFQIALAGKTTSLWQDNLQFLVQVLQDKNIAVLIDNPKVSKQQLGDLLLAIGEGIIDKKVGNFVQILIANGRLGLLAQIVILYQQLQANNAGYINADICSAYKLTPKEQAKITAILQKQWGKKIHLNSITVNKNLLGGFVAKAGDRVIDGSTRNRLQQLAKTITG